MEQRVLLRVFLGESDHHEGRPLSEAIVLKARELHIAGATVTRGVMGFGHHSRVHKAKVLRLSDDLPVIVEIIDREENLRPLLSWLDEVVVEGLVTTESVGIVQASEPAQPDVAE